MQSKESHLVGTRCRSGLQSRLCLRILYGMRQHWRADACGDVLRCPTSLAAAQREETSPGASAHELASSAAVEYDVPVPQRGTMQLAESSSERYMEEASECDIDGCRIGDIAVEMEPRFHALRSINEKDGTFEADVGIKVRFQAGFEVLPPNT